MKVRKVELERFEEAVAIVRRDFVWLDLRVDRENPNVDALAEIPTQEGLSFDVSFNLQNCDELHLNVSHFWVEWFPCGDQKVFDEFIEALTGVISGRCRILESYVCGTAVTARLQRPVAPDTWKTLATWGNLRAVIPWIRTHQVVQNRPSV